MAFLTSMNIIGSGMTAQQIRLDVISENVTNINTTRTPEGGPYRRKVIRLQAESTKGGRSLRDLSSLLPSYVARAIKSVSLFISGSSNEIFVKSKELNIRSFGKSGSKGSLSSSGMGSKYLSMGQYFMYIEFFE